MQQHPPTGAWLDHAHRDRAPRARRPVPGQGLRRADSRQVRAALHPQGRRRRWCRQTHTGVRLPRRGVCHGHVQH